MLKTVGAGGHYPTNKLQTEEGEGELASKEGSQNSIASSSLEGLKGRAEALAETALFAFYKVSFQQNISTIADTQLKWFYDFPKWWWMVECEKWSGNSNPCSNFVQQYFVGRFRMLCLDSIFVRQCSLMKHHECAELICLLQLLVENAPADSWRVKGFAALATGKSYPITVNSGRPCTSLHAVPISSPEGWSMHMNTKIIQKQSSDLDTSSLAQRLIWITFSSNLHVSKLYLSGPKMHSELYLTITIKNILPRMSVHPQTVDSQHLNTSSACLFPWACHHAAGQATPCAGEIVTLLYKLLIPGSMFAGPLKETLLAYYALTSDHTQRLQSVRANGKFSSITASSETPMSRSEDLTSIVQNAKVCPSSHLAMARFILTLWLLHVRSGRARAVFLYALCWDIDDGVAALVWEPWTVESFSCSVPSSVSHWEQHVEAADTETHRKSSQLLIKRAITQTLSWSGFRPCSLSCYYWDIAAQLTRPTFATTRGITMPPPIEYFVKILSHLWGLKRNSRTAERPSLIWRYFWCHVSWACWEGSSMYRISLGWSSYMRGTPYMATGLALQQEALLKCPTMHSLSCPNPPQVSRIMQAEAASLPAIDFSTSPEVLHVCFKRL